LRRAHLPHPRAGDGRAGGAARAAAVARAGGRAPVAGRDLARSAGLRRAHPRRPRGGAPRMSDGGGERLGIFGGTFDPPHVGHLVTAVNVRHEMRLDRVLLVVNHQPWQKLGTREISDAERRYAMVAAAVEGVEGLEASRIEIDRGGLSYTADTLRTLLDEDPTRELFVILGSDAAVGLPTWERADE